jgi:hypothetical protein
VISLKLRMSIITLAYYGCMLYVVYHILCIVYYILDIVCNMLYIVLFYVIIVCLFYVSRLCVVSRCI